MYTNQNLISAFLKRSLKDKELTILPFVIASVDSYIDYEIGSSFSDKLNDTGVTVTPTTRKYDGGNSIVSIDPAIEITEVYADGTILTTDEYTIHPVSQTVKAWIRLNRGRFVKGRNIISVTGKFSSGDVPSDIAYLATYLASQLLATSVSGDITKESIEGYSAEYKQFDMQSLSTDGVVSMILNKYRNNQLLIESV